MKISTPALVVIAVFALVLFVLFPVLFVLAVFLTPESICVYFFYNKIINKFLPRMAFIVLVVFLYANYIFLIPPSTYTFLPEAAATFVWAIWPPALTVALGFVVGKIESKGMFIESMYSGKSS